MKLDSEVNEICHNGRIPNLLIILCRRQAEPFSYREHKEIMHPWTDPETSNVELSPVQEKVSKTGSILSITCRMILLSIVNKCLLSEKIVLLPSCFLFPSSCCA
ncbi:UNVERIFIED_CONTAM: hypothetical protein K2H54_047356 [Gekko kuhli]